MVNLYKTVRDDIEPTSIGERLGLLSSPSMRTLSVWIEPALESDNNAATLEGTVYGWKRL